MKLRVQPTGSKIHRIWKCPASAILPQVVDEKREARTEPARGRGHVVHKYLERVKLVGKEQALGEVVDPEHLLLCKALDLDKLPAHLSTEVAYAWNWKNRTCRELGRNLGHRDYIALGLDPSCEIGLTLDAVGSVELMIEVSGEMQPFKRGYVGDYKAGRTKYPRPVKYGQTLLGAACVRYMMGCDDVVGELLYINDDGEIFPVRDIIDAWTLDAFEMELAEVMDSLPALSDEYQATGLIAKRAGDHCDYCDAYKHCDAKTGLIRQAPAELLQIGVRMASVPMFGADDRMLLAAVRDGEKMDPQTTKAMKKLMDRLLASQREEFQITPGAVTARNATAVWESCEWIEDICKRIRQEVVGIAWSTPVPLSDGRVIERYQHSKREVAGPIAALVLEEHYGREEASTAVTIDTSIEAIRQVVVRNLKEGEKITTVKETGVLDLLLKEIAKRGGLNNRVGEECKPHKPRLAKPAAKKR